MAAREYAVLKTQMSIYDRSITDVVLIIQGTLIGSEISAKVDPDSARMVIVT